MSTIQSRIQELYDDFSHLSSPRVVRSNQHGDAFTLLVYEALLGELTGVRRLSRSDPNHLDLLEQSVVPPPDDSIDIFFEEADLDDRTYHVLQCKNQKLAPSEVEKCFVLMKSAMDLYLSSPKDLRKPLRKLIQNSSFTKEDETSCIYYVVHTGTTQSIRNQRDNQKIINEKALTTIMQGTRQDDLGVPKGSFTVDTMNNFIVNNFADRDETKPDPNVPQSILCNLSGFDLAELDSQYSQSDIGRNILYAGNLRESLNKRGKTYASMFETIRTEPELFLFYNNGITILTESFDSKEIESTEKISLKNFSIINGAQTTSTLGAYLREAQANEDTEAIEKLRKVLVLTKIYQINHELKNHEKISELIKVNTNTQTPLSGRDMVSYRPEQKQLRQRLLDGKPPIFVTIKRGETAPRGVRLLKYRNAVSNENLAQLALCGFAFEPQTAISKKVRLFDDLGKEGILRNETYDYLFHPERGILFLRSYSLIDELLFVKQLHRDAQAAFKKKATEQISNLIQSSPADAGRKPEERNDAVDQLRRTLDIANRIVFYDTACYFKIRERFDFKIKGIEKMTFRTTEYYDNKQFRARLVTAFTELFFMRTIEVILKQTEGVSNIYNWLRTEKNQARFFAGLNDAINLDYSLDDKYMAFVKEFKLEE